MVVRTRNALEALYEADETAWLDNMAELIREHRYEELDFSHLQEYLSDMAIRDRRRVESRLTRLLEHILKWGLSTGPTHSRLAPYDHHPAAGVGRRRWPVASCEITQKRSCRRRTPKPWCGPRRLPDCELRLSRPHANTRSIRS
jgi:Domain of unknown function DUF29